LLPTVRGWWAAKTTGIYGGHKILNLMALLVLTTL
jgi:hypothetical protein